MQTTALRRVSTHAFTNAIASRCAEYIRTRDSTRSCLLEDVFNPDDEFGPGFELFGQPITVVHAREQWVPSFRIIRKLGVVSYAVVYLVEEIIPTTYADNLLNIPEESDTDGESRLASRKPVAVGRQFTVKCLAKHAQGQEAQLLGASIHQSLPVHPNVVTLHTTLETTSYLLLVLDYVPGENLFDFLEQWRDHDQYVPGSSTNPAPAALASILSSSAQLLSYHRLRLIASMFSQMCNAVAHCHRNGVFHRDIKPENFMVTDSRVFNPATGDHERKVVVKLTDFGLATRDTDSGDMDCGSAPYMSFGKARVSPSSQFISKIFLLVTHFFGRMSQQHHTKLRHSSRRRLVSGHRLDQHALSCQPMAHHDDWPLSIIRLLPQRAHTLLHGSFPWHDARCSRVLR
jgi:serine/threonine protein kinase